MYTLIPRWFSQTSRQRWDWKSLCVAFLDVYFLTFARRVCWNARLPFPRSAKKGGLWETCGHLGMWWVTHSLLIEFFASISIFFLSRHPTHIQTHQLSDVESSFRQVLSRGCCQAPLSPPSCFTSTFTLRISRWDGVVLSMVGSDSFQLSGSLGQFVYQWSNSQIQSFSKCNTHY